ncbi:MAG TPA: hypothetical protein H9881_08385 [Candidatus Stackebrandtia excrementipullorum]|nr:hypothetical protein [Candidatus Stackebrandtia excrementipullorum]
MSLCGAGGVAGVIVFLIGLLLGSPILIFAGIAGVIVGYCIAARIDESHR